MSEATVLDASLVDRLRARIDTLIDDRAIARAEHQQALAQINDLRTELRRAVRAAAQRERKLREWIAEPPGGPIVTRCATEIAAERVDELRREQDARRHRENRLRHEVARLRERLEIQERLHTTETARLKRLLHAARKKNTKGAALRLRGQTRSAQGGEA